MTVMLDKAFKRVAKLPEMEQNILAKWIIEILDSDKKWEQLLSESEDTLEKLAMKAVLLS